MQKSGPVALPAESCSSRESAMLRALEFKIMMAFVWLLWASMRAMKDDTTSRHVDSPEYSAWWTESIVASRESKGMVCASTALQLSAARIIWQNSTMLYDDLEKGLTAEPEHYH